MLVDSMPPSIALHARWGSMQRPDLKARFRILDYPTMGESDGASLRQMGDA